MNKRTGRYLVETMVNGLYRVYDYRSGLSGLYNEDMTYRSGDLRMSHFQAINLIKWGRIS